jgi:hypothetical protein
MKIPPSTPSPSEVPHSLHLTPQSKAGSYADIRVGGPPVGSGPSDEAAGARAYYAAPPGELDLRA